MYETILVAYDGTRPSREAVHQGATIAAMCRAKVHLLAVVSTEPGIALAQAAAPLVLAENECEEAQFALAEQTEHFRKAGLTVEAHLAAGIPAQEIGRLAREVGANLIVVGHREQGAIARWWGGSVGESLLAHAPCSILVAIGHVLGGPGG